MAYYGIISFMSEVSHNKKYELPLSKKEMESVVEEAKEFVNKYIDCDVSSWEHYRVIRDKKISLELKRKDKKCDVKDEYIKLIKNDDILKGKIEKAKLIKPVLDDYKKCSLKTQELIALGLSGLLNTEEKYIIMYRNKEYEEIDYEKEYRKWTGEEMEPEYFGWDDGVYLSTGDDWDYNPDREREYEEEYLCCESPYLEEYEYEDDKEREFLDSLNKMDNYDYYKRIIRFIDHIRIDIEKQIEHSYSKRKHHDDFVYLYKAIQESLYKLELKELIRIDLCDCDYITLWLVKTIIEEYRDMFYEYPVVTVDFNGIIPETVGESNVLEKCEEIYELYYNPERDEKEIAKENKRSIHNLMEEIKMLNVECFNELCKQINEYTTKIIESLK